MTGKRYFHIELYLFLAFSIVSILPFILVKYVPSLDGPQHLYTARLIAELLQGDELITRFFMLNPVIVGNLGSQYILAFLLFAFPAWLAEKIFVSFFIIGLALSFRYFIRSMAKPGTLLYLLIFPFAFTSLFMLGYYNFSLAFIPFFLCLGYTIRHEKRPGIKEILMMVTLILLIYLTHAIVFMFFILIIILQMIFDLAYPLVWRADGLKGWASVWKKYLVILGSSAPAIFLWSVYYFSLDHISLDSASVSIQPVVESLNGLYRLNILTGFHHGEEAGPNSFMFWGIAALIALAVIPFPRYVQGFTRKDHDSENNPVRLKWAFITIVLFSAAILVPNQLGTGNMSARVGVMFFLGLITWISLQKFSRIIIITALVLLFGTFTWHRMVIFKYYKNLNREIAVLEQAGEFIEPQSVLYPVNCSDNWLQTHFHCYLGVDKPIVDLRMPQANPEMPLIWNHASMPGVLLGELNQEQTWSHWVAGNKSLIPVPADYIFVWKSQRMEVEEGVIPLLEKVGPFYTRTYRSEDGTALLLELK
jgi:hypothetical protein